MRAILGKLLAKFNWLGINSVSGGHKIISREQAENLAYDAKWQDPSLPAKQWKIVEKELAQIKKTGVFPKHMQVLVNLIKQINITQGNILEIGCSSGYYAEILKLAGINLTYSGCDYSAAFIDLARKLYPENDFKICAATDLPYLDNAFDVSVSGCCILHILDYATAIKETIRVGSKYILLSRTPVFEKTPTTYTQKLGYGIKMIEIIFNEQELIELCKKYGAELVGTETIHADLAIPGCAEKVKIKTYLFKKYAA